MKERALRDRESAIGVRLDAYLMSKCTVLFAMVSLQVMLMMGLVFAMRPLHESAGAYLAVFALFVVTGIAATGLGLLVSAVVTTEDQAMTIVPLVLIPQIVFAGAVVPIDRMLQPFKALSYVHLSQWSLSSIGTQIHMNGRMASSPEFARVNRFGTDFFDIGLGTGIGIMLVFLVVFLATTALVLYRRNRHG